MRNVLTNVLGARDTVDVHVTERTLRRATCCCCAPTACTACCDPDTLQQILRAPTDFDATAADARRPRRWTRARRDNVTALVVRYEADR